MFEVNKLFNLLGRGIGLVRYGIEVGVGIYSLRDIITCTGVIENTLIIVISVCFAKYSLGRAHVGVNRQVAGVPGVSVPHGSDDRERRQRLQNVISISKLCRGRTELTPATA